jgi:hypothetical protein
MVNVVNACIGIVGSVHDMSDSDQRVGWKLSTRRGRTLASGGPQRADRSPSKLTRLFRGIADSAPSASTSQPQPSSSFTQDSRRNAVLLDVTPEDLRPPSRASLTDSINTVNTSRFSLVSPPSPPLDIDISNSQSLDTLIRSSSKRFLPKIRDHLSSGSKHQRLFTLRRKQRGVSYPADGEPLDGEEGELIDDEACYMDPCVSKGMGEHRLITY